MQVNVTTVPAVFTFAPDLTLRVYDTEGNPWFVAVDIERMFGISNIRKRVASLDEDERSAVPAPQGGSPLTVVNESGLWTLVLRSDAALQKGTAAYKARKWVTSEVLPAIRRTGRYEAPKPEYITVEHRWAIQKAVGRKARGQSVHYQTVYRALKDHFKVEKYTHILEADFDAAIAFIESLPPMQLPPLNAPAPRQLSAAPQKEPRKFLVDEKYLERQRTFIYNWRYLYKDSLELILELLYRMQSPLAPALWEAIHDMYLWKAERDLAKLGYDVKELDCYKSWASHQPKRLTA
jgi:prophage antirepressor-like protein